MANVEPSISRSEKRQNAFSSATATNQIANSWGVRLGAVLAIVLVVVILWGLITYVVLPWMPDLGPSGGIKGDAFGAVNALFSGLALAGVIAAIMLQSEELKLQRGELEETRKELHGQKVQLEEQVKQSLRREFDSRFFQAIGLYHQQIEAISIKAGDKLLTGVAALSHFQSYLRWAVPTGGHGGPFGKCDKDFGHQFRQSMQMLEFLFALLDHENASEFHSSLLDSSCGPIDRRVFLFFILDKPDCKPNVFQKLCLMEFLRGVSPPTPEVDLKSLTPEAFGFDNWQGIGRNEPGV